MNKKKIFITRSLSSDSPILQVKGAHNIVGKSLIDISSSSFDMPKCDWLFFYSRNGVIFLLNKEKDLSAIKIAAIGSGTAEKLRLAGQKVDFVGRGDADSIATEFKKVVSSEENVCFIRAENSNNSIFSRMECNNHFDLVVYKNIKSRDIPQQEFDILIFTSSMNAEAYFDSCEYNNQPCIAIGKPTAITLKEKKISNIIIADDATEESIAEKLKMLLK